MFRVLESRLKVPSTPIKYAKPRTTFCMPFSQSKLLSNLPSHGMMLLIRVPVSWQIPSSNSDISTSLGR